MGNRQAITRNIFVPKMTLKELDEAIKWEAERYIPFPIDRGGLGLLRARQPRRRWRRRGSWKWSIAAARMDLVTQQVEYLKLAGLEPVVVDIKPFSLLRSLRGSLLGAHLNKTTLTGASYTEADEVGGGAGNRRVEHDHYFGARRGAC